LTLLLDLNPTAKFSADKSGFLELAHYTKEEGELVKGETKTGRI